MTDDSLIDELKAHAVNCQHPRRACIVCRAREEIERHAGDVDAIRFEREDARTRLGLFHGLVQETLPRVLAGTEQLLKGEGLAELLTAGPPEQAFEQIQSGAEVADTLRRTQRELEVAQERLYRIRSVHARHAARARLGQEELHRTARAIATAIAHGWHGAGFEGDPLAHLDIYALEAGR